VEGVFHDNVIPAAGEYEGPIELRLVFQTAETFNARGDGILIALGDVASACMQESFKPRAVDL
jgi:hypothetical protein